MNEEMIINMINNSVENEFELFVKEDLRTMKNLSQYEMLTNRSSELYNELKKELSPELMTKLSELDEILATISARENEYCFRKGVGAGLTRLKYLDDVNAGAVLYYD